MYLEPLIYFLAILLLNGFIGFGVSLFFYKGPLISRLLMSPIISYAVITLCTAYLSYLGLGTNQFALILSALLAIVSLTGILTKRTSLQQGEKTTIKLLTPIIIFCLINSLLVLGATLLDHAPYLFNDHTTYISISEYLRSFGYSQAANPTTPFWENNTWMYQEMHFRMGAQFFVSFFAALFRVGHTIQMYSGVLGFVAFISEAVIALLYLAIRSSKATFGELSFVLFFSVIAINLNSQNLAIGFLPQTCGIVLLIALTALLYELFHHNKAAWITSAVLFAALVFTYHEITLFYGAGVVTLCLYELLYKRNRNYPLFYKIAGTHIAALVLSPIGTREFIFGIQSSSQANDVGWNVPYSFLRYFQSILGQDIHYLLPNIFERYITLPGLLVTFILGYIFIKHILLREQRNLIQFVSAFFLPYALALWLFAYLKFDPFNHLLGHTWRIFKLMSWGYWIIPVLIGLALYAYFKESRLKKYLVIAMVVSLLPSAAGNVYAQYLNQKYEMEMYTNNYTDPLGDFEYISEHKAEFTPANIIDYVSHPNYSYLLLSILKDTSTGDLDIFGSKLTPSIAPQYFPWVNYRREHANTGRLLTTKAGFSIYSANSSTVYLDKGFSARESYPENHLAWMTSKKGTIKVIIPEGAKAQFSTEISNWHASPDQVEISLNNTVLFSTQISETSEKFTSPILEAGIYEFQINFTGELRKADASDGRTLGLMFKNTSIKNS